MKDTDLTPRPPSLIRFAGKGVSEASTVAVRRSIPIREGDVGSCYRWPRGILPSVLVRCSRPENSGREGVSKPDGKPRLQGNVAEVDTPFPALYLLGKGGGGLGSRKVRFLALLLLAAAISAGAQTPPRPLALDESVTIALQQSPQARAARFARDAAQTQADRDKPVAAHARCHRFRDRAGSSRHSDPDPRASR